MDESFEPIDASDEALWGWMADAHLPSLMPALAQVTGDLSLVSDALRPPLPQLPIPAPQGGMGPELVHKARHAAFAALRRFRDGGSRPAPPPTESALRAMIKFLSPDPSEDLLNVLHHEIAHPADMGRPSWHKQDIAPERKLSVAIIGAGMSGLGMAHRLAQAGVPFVVFERNEDVGGTWLVNRYPGCRLDTSNFCYSYSFLQKPDWPQYFSAREPIHQYFRDFAERLDLRSKIRFGTAVVSATYNESECHWALRVVAPDGQEETLEFELVVSAVGQLNSPLYPQIPGRESFTGKTWHTANWDHSASLEGLRVGVIGTGASAFQMIPEIAGDVAQLCVFQRSPPWFIPTATYHSDLAPGFAWLLRHIPHYHRWYRFFQFAVSVEGRRPFALVDPEWTQEGSVSRHNEVLRQALIDNLEKQFADRPDLLAKVIPRHAPYSKRMLLDDGTWARTLKQPHVQLVDQAIDSIGPRGITTADGRQHELDVIIYGTGFAASNFLNSLTVTGRGGCDLHDEWAGDARAYLGMNIPKFPNLFCLYGPNTNLVVNGSLILFAECEINYVMKCLETLLVRDVRAMEVTQSAYEDFGRKVDQGNQLTAWGTASARSWYKNATGRVSQNWPLSTLEFWRLTREPKLQDYVLKS